MTVSLPATARLILAINQFLVQVIEQGDAATATSSHQLNGNEDMDASENGGSEMVTINDTSVICGLLEIIVILWYGNRQQFDKVVYHLCILCIYSGTCLIGILENENTCIFLITT